MKQWIYDFQHLVYPHTCMGCGTDEIEGTQYLCLTCLYSLPKTNFFSQSFNPVEEKFWGRTKIKHAGSAFFYDKDSSLQQLLKALKYRRNKDCGYFLSDLLMQEMKTACWLRELDAIIPLPLSEQRQHHRGYNQATVLSSAISRELQIPIWENAVARTVNTESQTHKTREERWSSMQNIFEIISTNQLEGKHLLLVDDVLTTGATMEVLCQSINKIAGVEISVATLAYTV